MGKLYAVTSGRYSDYGIITLCSDKERAESIVRWYNRYEKYDKASVEEYEDGIVVPDESVEPYEVTFLDDGSLKKVENCGPSHIFYRRMLKCVDGRLIFYVLAEDEESAKKIAAEKRAKYIAETSGEV